MGSLEEVFRIATPAHPAFVQSTIFRWRVLVAPVCIEVPEGSSVAAASI